MSSIMKVFLLLAVMVCISSASPMSDSGSQCLCQRVRNKLIAKSDMKEIQVYQATIFCDKVEIVVTNNSGLRYCLNPTLKAVQKLIATILKPKTSTTARPTEVASSPSSSSSSSTAHM